MTIRFREDGYVCLTDMAKASGKRYPDWSRLDSTKSYLEALSSVTGKTVSQLVQVQQGGHPESQGTWGHPEVAKEFQRWCNQKAIKKSTKVFEESYRDKLALTTGGKVEVVCQSGRVDILTETEVIEVKKANQWKAAVGQALVYSCEFPDRTPRVHLTGDVSVDFKTMVTKFCTQLGVRVTFEP